MRQEGGWVMRDPQRYEVRPLDLSLLMDSVKIDFRHFNDQTQGGTPNRLYL